MLSLLAFGVPSVASTTPIQTGATSTPVIVQETTTTSSIETNRQLVENIAKIYGVDKNVALHIAEHESKFLATARGDQKIFANGNGGCTNKKSPLYGKPANARGIWAITECWWPEVTDAQADDPEWSTHWAMKQLSDGNCNLWSTCPLD